MFKTIMTALFLTLSSFSYAVERPNFFEDFEVEDEYFIHHVGSGYTNLEQRLYLEAVRDFNEAHMIFRQDVNIPRELEFILVFGELIAYDNLGMQDRCEQILGRFFINVMASEGEVDEDDDDDMLTPEDEKAVGYMRALASLAPSQDIARVLHTFLDGMEAN